MQRHLQLGGYNGGLTMPRHGLRYHEIATRTRAQVQPLDNVPRGDVARTSPEQEGDRRVRGQVVREVSGWFGQGSFAVLESIDPRTECVVSSPGVVKNSYAGRFKEVREERRGKGTEEEGR